MTWIAQVRLVFVKDALEARYFLFAYVAIVIVATVRASGLEFVGERVLGDGVLIVVLAGMFLIALVVQADSPIRSDAFWATQPLRSSAVLGAKVGFGLMLITLAAIGQAVALRPYGVPPMTVLAVVLSATPVLAGWLLAAMIIASLSRDLRSFAVALVVVPIVMTALSAVIAYEGAFILPPQTALVLRMDLVAVLLGLGLMAWIYRMRDTRLTTRMGGFAVALFALMTMATRTPVPFDPDAPPELVGRVGLTLELPRNELRTDGSELQVVVTAHELPRELRLALAAAVMEIRLRDGSMLRIPVDSDVGRLDPWTSPIPRGTDLEWLGRTGPEHAMMNVTARLSAEQRRAVNAGVSAIVLDARVVVVEAVASARMPLTTGSEVSVSGQRARVMDWSHEFGEPMLIVRIGRLLVDRSQLALSSLWWGGSVQPALVNPARGEAAMLWQRGSRGGSDGTVLPGMPLESRTAEFGWMYGGGPAGGTLDDAWFRQAELLLVTHEVRGSYPVRLEIELPSDGGVDGARALGAADRG